MYLKQMLSMENKKTTSICEKEIKHHTFFVRSLSYLDTLNTGIKL
jgi:hypothetical protein